MQPVPTNQAARSGARVAGDGDVVRGESHPACDTVPAATWSTGAAPHDRPFTDQLVRVLGEAAMQQLGVFPLPPGFVLSVVMPIYNERRTIREIVDRVRAVPIPKEIIIVDDCSRDGTREILKEMEQDADLKICYHDRNQGKGAALRSGFRHATGDVIVIQDADLEYDPREYPRLIQSIVDGRADVVYGSRFRGDLVRVHLFWHRVANYLLTTLSNATTNLNLSDMETCYKAFRHSAIDGMQLSQQRFGFEPEITAKFARRKLRIFEVPISYAGRDYSEGKKIGALDALHAVYCILRYAVAD